MFRLIALFLTVFLCVVSVAAVYYNEIPILVEKPVGWHPIQLEKLIESNPSGAQKVMVAYNRRYYKIVDLLKDYIDNNDQGLITISIPDSISSIRQFLVNGCHMVDLLCYLMIHTL